jgi:acetolactate synthase-1/2/3 large subunit
MKFSVAATSMLCAIAANHAAAFSIAPSPTAFGVRSTTSTSTSTSTAARNLHTIRQRNGKASSSLFVLNEDLAATGSTVGEIEEGAGKTFTPRNRKTFATPNEATTAYLSIYEGQSGASIVYSKLVENGVDVVNGYSGGAVLPLLDQFHEKHPRHAHLDKPPIRWITNSNENSAGHIAEGYAKSAPKMPDGKQPAGVVVATSGPGVTNLITPLQDAICDGVPMVVLCGQAATNAPADAFQAAPAVDLTTPCTKWSYQIKSAAELPYVMDYAFFIARNGRPGPVFVDLPKDLQNQVLTQESIDAFAAGVPHKGVDGADNYDGIMRFMPRFNGEADHLYHLGMPDRGILFASNDDNTKLEPVLEGKFLEEDEVKFQFDHNPANTVYNRNKDTGEQTEGDLQPGTKLMGKMYDLIRKAKKPLIIAGQGCNECPEELKWFAESMKIPVTSTLHGLGCFDERHELALNMVGMHGHPTPNFMTQQADLIICVGSRFDDRITGNMGAYIPEAKKAADEYRGGVIHVDIRLSQKASQIEPAFFIHSTGKNFFEAINTEIRTQRAADPFQAGTHTGEWLAHKASLQKEFPVKVPFFPSETVNGTDKDGNQVGVSRTRMSAQSVVSEMDKQLLAGNAIDNCFFSTGVGIHQMVTAQLVTWTQPKQMISSGSLGTMGVALGFVIGSKLANGEKMCIAVDGDGSFNMTFTELKTVAEQNIPVKILILDNESQMMVEYWQRLFHDERYLAVTNTVNPKYGTLADAFNIKNLYCDNQEDLADVMKEFLFADPDKPVLMHARIERTPCLPLVAPGAPLQDMILEDSDTDYGFDASAAPS